MKLQHLLFSGLLLIGAYYVAVEVLQVVQLSGSFCGGNVITIKSSSSQNNWAADQYSDIDDERTGTIYEPSAPEDYLIHNLTKLGMGGNSWTSTCHIWKKDGGMPTEQFHQMQAFLPELKAHYDRIKAFRFTNFDPLKMDIRRAPQGDAVCDEIDRGMGGSDLSQLFNKSKILSKTSTNGYVEPLLSPLRHPLFCQNMNKYLLDIDYLIHDFGNTCRHLRKNTHARTVFVDMGASLAFHGKETSPAIVVMDLWRKFGIQFDHIYAFEYTKQDPQFVFNAIPDHYKSAYHWYNVGVTSDELGDQNPWNILLENFRPDDLIVVKLDIDTPSLESELVNQLLNNPKLHSLVDHFYFEYHHRQAELQRWWRSSGDHATVKQSFELFYQLRQKGIAAHSWV